MTLLGQILRNARAPQAATTAVLLKQLAGLAAEIHALSLTYLPEAENVVRVSVYSLVPRCPLLCLSALSILPSFLPFTPTS